MKKCFRCNDVKSLDDFYVHRRMADGHLNKCKDCCRAEARTNKRVERRCVTCRITFMANINEIKRRGGGAKNCSRDCYYKYAKLLAEEKWDRLGRRPSSTYSRAHRFIREKCGKAMRCDDCGSDNLSYYHWANLSGSYLLDVKDWRQMCPSCHKRYDNAMYERTGKRAIASLG